MPVIINDLRQSGVRADMSYGHRGLKGSMKAADRAGARFALVIGEDELAKSIVQVKDLHEGEQTAVPLDQVVQEVRGRLSA